MKRLAPILLVAVLAAGCTAKGGDQDPWAYTKKPLYASGFNLERIAGSEETQQFRVTDGSIAGIRMQVWVNATAGGGTVTIRDPGGKSILTTSSTADEVTMLNLGQWTVQVVGQAGSVGIVHVLVTRT